MSAIFERELRAYFQNITGWLFLAAYAVVYDIYYFYYNLYTGYAYISYALSSIIMVMLVLIPVLTMRSMAEDRKFKTDQLLYSAPVSVMQIVAGKYIAMASIYSFAMIFTCITPIILTAFGQVPFAASYTAVLGMWLFGLMAIAVGQFISSLTENQIVSAVVSFAVLLLGHLMNTFSTLVSSTSHVLIAVMKAFAITAPLSKFNNGILSITGIVYYVSAGAFFLLLTAMIIMRKRNGRGASFKQGSIAMMAVSFAVLAAVNIGMSFIPAKYTQIDASANKMFELSDTTYDFIDTVKDDITVYVWGEKDSVASALTYTLDRYDSASSHISVKYIDPKVSPTFYKDYTSLEPQVGSLIVTGDNRYKVIDYEDLFSYGIDSATQSRYIAGYDGEGKLTAAINYCSGAETQYVCMISGHGENSLEESFINEMEKQNYEVKTVNLTDSGSLPENTVGVIINGPTRDFSKDEMKILKEYFGGGGKALITTNYKADYLDRLYGYLADTYNIQMQTGMVFEGSEKKYYNQPMFIFPTVVECDLTETINTDNHILMPYSQAIRMGSNVNQVVYTDLIYTSGSGYIKSDVAGLSNFKKKSGDESGQITIGVNAIDHATEADVTVIGSFVAFTEDADGTVAGNNMNLFTGITAAFSDGSESRLAIPAKSYTVQNLSTNKSVAYALFGILVFLIPAVLLVTGTVIWIRRRKR